VLKTQICVTRPQCVNIDDDGAHTDHQARRMSHKRLLLGGGHGAVYTKVY
jgi:hypothetical protein